MSTRDKIYSKQIGKWCFCKFIQAPGVVWAETRFKGYDEDWMLDIQEALQERRYRVYIDWTDEESVRSYRKMKTSVEIYRKFPKDMDFQDCFAAMQKDFNELIPESRLY